MSAAYKTASKDHNFKKAFPEKPLIAYRRQKNIGEIITRAKLHPLPREGGVERREQAPGFKKCRRFGGRGCAMCPYVENATSHYSTATGESFKIKNFITCTTSNVIYDLWCDKCRNSPSVTKGSDQYTGRTSNMASIRFSAHKSDVNTGRISKAVSEHFKLPGHKVSDMRFLPFEIVTESNETLLASRETYWIDRKKNLQFGINRQK